MDSRTVAMKVEPAKECVTTHLPKCTAPKMDGAQVSEAELALQSTATVAAEQSIVV